VESQCGKKADYTSWDPLACLDEAVVLGQMSIACDVETASNFLELASTLKTKEILTGNIVLGRSRGRSTPARLTRVITLSSISLGIYKS
jgi:hypothetical protein